MENFSFGLYMLMYVVVLGIAWFLIGKFNQEYKLYCKFSKGDEMLKLMAKDPLRFHNSIVYLMVCAMHSNYSSLQYDKLKLIVRYICEVCPVVYQKEMLVNLKKLIGDEEFRNRFSGDNPIIDIDSFLKGKPDFIKKFVTYSYVIPLNGVGLAEEMSKILTEDDKIYLMYILFRVATANGRFTTTGSESSLDVMNKLVMNKLCVDGLKIAKEELNLLIQQYTNKNLQGWYDEHFGRKSELYPSFDQIGSVFRSEDKPFAFVDQVKETVMTKSVCDVWVYSMLLSIIIYGVIACRISSLGMLAVGFFIPFGGFFVIAAFRPLSNQDFESIRYYILRTKKENECLFGFLIIYAVCSLIYIFLLLWGISYLLYLDGYKLWWI